MSTKHTAIYPHVLAYVYGRPWALAEPTMNVVLEILGQRAGGFRMEQAEIEERLSAASQVNGPRDQASGSRQANVAVIPIYGVISPRSGLMSGGSSGGTSVEDIRADFRAAMADDSIDALTFDVDSPGGVVDGLPELFSEMFEARGQKPMTAVANTQMASGALWLASAADRIVASPSATVGSIGVIGVHKDKSAQYASQGIKTTIIRTAKFKGEGSDSEPLSDEAVAAMQADAQFYDDMFVNDVAKARGVTTEYVRSAFGQGRTLVSAKALSAGLIDGVQTLEHAVAATAMTVLGGGQPLLANGLPTVLSLSAQAAVPVTEQGFAERLRLATAEMEAVVGIARDRSTRRAEDGRPLSKATQEHLERALTAMESLATGNVDPEPLGRVASVKALDLMIRMYQEDPSR